MTAQASVENSRQAPDFLVRTMAALFVEMETWPAQVEETFLENWFQRQGHQDPRGADGCSNIFEYLAQEMFSCRKEGGAWASQLDVRGSGACSMQGMHKKEKWIDP